MHGVESSPIGTRDSAISVVTEETVKTSQGREDYLRFLKANSTISPICKLFGLNASKEVKSSEINTHAKRLFRWIHPDKVEEGEKPLCTELFQIVKEAQEESTQKKLLSGSFWFPGSYLFSEVPEVVLSGYIGDRLWTRAKQCIVEGKVVVGPDLKGALLATLIFIKCGDLKGAIQYGERCSDKVFQALTFCAQCIDDCQLPSGSDVQTKCGDLHTALSKMQSLKQIFQELEGAGCEGWLPRHILPYTLFVALKDAERSSNNFIMYDTYLREAIRFCPYGLPAERQALIAELQCWIAEQYADEVIKRDTSNLEQRLVDEFRAIPELMNKERHVSAFVNSPSCPLEPLIKRIRKIINKSNYRFSDLFPNGIKFIGDLLWAYPDRVIEKLKKLLPLLEGIALYRKGDASKAASYFSREGEYFTLGLLCLELEEYGWAFQAFEKLHAQTSLPIDQEVLMRHMAVALNLHDTNAKAPRLSEETELQQVDDVQSNVIKRCCLCITTIDK